MISANIITIRLCSVRWLMSRIKFLSIRTHAIASTTQYHVIVKVKKYVYRVASFFSFVVYTLYGQITREYIQRNTSKTCDEEINHIFFFVSSQGTFHIFTYRLQERESLKVNILSCSLFSSIISIFLERHWSSALVVVAEHNDRIHLFS